METQKEITNVIFLFEEESKDFVYAYFPNDIFSYDKQGNPLYTAYAHIGQHSGCSQEYMRECVMCEREYDYMELKQELESIGYNLNVLNFVKTAKFDRKVKKEMARIKQFGL